MPEIKVIIENGTAKVETTGFVGKACQDATAELEKAMGLTTSDTKTPEWELEQVRSIGQG